MISTTSKVNPVRASNAIDEIAFVISFEKETSGQNLDDLRQLEYELKSDLPDFSLTNVMQVSIDPQGVRMPLSMPGGVICSKKSNIDDTRLEWSLRVDANTIVVRCTEFNQWSEVRAQAIRFLMAACNKLKLEDNSIVEIAYQCIDKFIINDENDTYRVSDIFNTKSQYLTPKISEGNFSSWHVHQGWFDEEDNIKMLNNLNLNTYQRSDQGGIETVISHLIKIRKSDVGNIEEMTCLQDVENLEDYLERAIKLSHHANKNILKSLLVPDLLQKINLK